MTQNDPNSPQITQRDPPMHPRCQTRTFVLNLAEDGR